MRKLLTLALFVAVIAGAAVLVGAAQTAVERHYDVVQAEQENTRLERRLSALRATAPETGGGGGSTLPALVGAVAVLLAASALIGQGGLVALLGNANKVIRSSRSYLRRSRSRGHVAPRPPDRYIVRQPPALPGNIVEEEEPSHWI